MSWHQVEQLTANLYRISERLDRVEPRFGIRTVNMYLLLGEERAALIDTGCGIGDLRGVVARLTDLPVMVLNSHYHWDHVGANAQFAGGAIHRIEAGLLVQEQDLSEYRAAMAAPSAMAMLPDGFDPAGWRIQPPPPSRLLTGGDRVDLGGTVLTALHTPGHSPGHISFLDERQGVLFCADLAYQGPVFICFEDADPAAFAASIRMAAALPGIQLICPGHNAPIRQPGWLGQFAADAALALTGEVEGALRREYVVGREFDFGEYAIWLPAQHRPSP